MHALDEAMTNMDDEEYLVEMLLVTGKSHNRFEDLSASIFWVSPSTLVCLSTIVGSPEMASPVRR